jgi:hypothetical protein
MKKLILLLVFFAGSFLCQTTFAQVSFKDNISSQPIWGPIGYDHVEYYYLPDLEMYYYVPRHKFIYLEKGKWLTRSSLPSSYKNYDMYNARKVVVNEPKPYLHFQDYINKYESSYDPLTQTLIRDSHEPRYFVNKDHPEHYKLKGNK